MAVVIDGTTGLVVPGRLRRWTTAGRPAVPGLGDEGINTTLGCKEYFNGTYWIQEGWQRGEASAMSGSSGTVAVPAPWANEVLLSIHGASHNSGTATYLLMQLGGASGLVTSGYVGGVSAATVFSGLTNGMRTITNAAATLTTLTLRCLRNTDGWDLTMSGHYHDGTPVSADGFVPMTEDLTHFGWSWAAGTTDAGIVQPFWRT